MQAHVQKRSPAFHLGLSLDSLVRLCLLACVPLGQLMSNVKSSQALDLLPTTSCKGKSGHGARTQTKCEAVTAVLCECSVCRL
ncbi:hypothetical protein PBY51_024758 [Eleginops maclovinus]|uniref:Secreted protein n=1 Tax=Eleginops maclovinus TaxID=56733 RepID=A0AAN7XZA2_ELEMC|nr:hypothetical protein PBY51_024758 [Eleginops maclovinus]